MLELVRAIIIGCCSYLLLTLNMPLSITFPLIMVAIYILYLNN